MCVCKKKKQTRNPHLRYHFTTSGARENNAVAKTRKISSIYVWLPKRITKLKKCSLHVVYGEVKPRNRAISHPTETTTLVRWGSTRENYIKMIDSKTIKKGESGTSQQPTIIKKCCAVSTVSIRAFGNTEVKKKQRFRWDRNMSSRMLMEEYSSLAQRVTILPTPTTYIYNIYMPQYKDSAVCCQVK